MNKNQLAMKRYTDETKQEQRQIQLNKKNIEEWNEKTKKNK